MAYAGLQMFPDVWIRCVPENDTISVDGTEFSQCNGDDPEWIAGVQCSQIYP
jgi:hypothetical protein